MQREEDVESNLETRVFSGIHPSADLHLGHYIGKVRPWIGLQAEYDCIFAIADLHSLTRSRNRIDLQSRILQSAINNIACGLDPEKCTLFLQSHIPQHLELTWILSAITPLQALQRLADFRAHMNPARESPSVGLLAYPVLQAADILLYQARKVPVGEDQIPQIEICRDIVRRFNRMFGAYFTEPVALTSDTPRIMGIDGRTKMSEARGNVIGILEEPSTIQAKLRSSVTDENRKRLSDPGDPDLCNIFSLHRAFSSSDQCLQIARDCRTAVIGCVDCKAILFDNLVEELEPIRRKAEELGKAPDRVRDILASGASRCRVIAEQVVAEVKQLVGLM